MTIQEQLERLRDEIAVKAGKERTLWGARVPPGRTWSPKPGGNSGTQDPSTWGQEAKAQSEALAQLSRKLQSSEALVPGTGPGMVDLMVHSDIALSRGPMIELKVIRYENPSNRWKGKEVEPPARVDPQVF